MLNYSLTEGQRNLFCRLAVFSSSMTEEAVRSICIEEGGSDWQSDLGELERRSFLDRIEIAAQDESGNEVTFYRYKLHPLMRQYAAGKAGEALLARLRPRAAAYFLGYSRHFANDLFMLSMEHENLLAAMDWFSGRQGSASGEERKTEANSFLQFMSFLSGYLDTLGYWNECERCMRQAIVAAETLEDKELIAEWSNYLAFLSIRKGDYDSARNLCHRSLEISQNMGYTASVARSLHLLGLLSDCTNDYDAASKFYQQSLEIHQTLDDKNALANLLGDLGGLAIGAEEYDQAFKLLNQCREIFQNIDNMGGVSKALTNLGIVAQYTGDFDEARKLYQQSLEIARKMGDKNVVALNQGQLARLEEKMGNVKAALHLIRQAEAAFRELGSPYAELAKKDRQRLEHNQ